MAGDDQPDLAFGQPGLELDVSVRDGSLVVGHEVVGGRADEAVGDRDGAYADRREEDAHGSILTEDPCARQPFRLLCLLKLQGHASVGSSNAGVGAPVPEAGNWLFLHGQTPVESREGD